jgi:hypothetical protein
MVRTVKVILHQFWVRKFFPWKYKYAKFILKSNKYAKYILKLNKYANFILKLNKYTKFILKLNKYKSNLLQYLFKWFFLFKFWYSKIKPYLYNDFMYYWNKFSIFI